MRLIGGDELRGLLSMGAAIDALEAAFAAGVPPVPLRMRATTPDGELLLMPAAAAHGLGVKLITLTPGNRERGVPFVQGIYALFSPGTQAPEAVIDGAALTALRTGAVSGLATRRLARRDAHRLVVFGAGVQARSHVEAVRAVRDIDDVVIVSRSAATAAALAEEVGGRAGEPGDVAGADIVCTCTTSPVPVFDGARLPVGAHVNAVGASTPETREVDTSTVVRARVVVETREAAMDEAGVLLQPIAEGAVEAAHVVADLSEALGSAVVRRSSEDLTLFVSVGLAFEDLVVARAALDA